MANFLENYVSGSRMSHPDQSRLGHSRLGLSRLGQGLLPLVLVAAWLTPALLLSAASHAGTSYERARVVDVQPLYKIVSYTVPVEHCRQEQVALPGSHARRGSATGPILGAIIGGALGNAVGHHSSNKKVGAVVGAVLGGSIGADISRKHRHRNAYDEVRYRTEEVCSVSREVHEEERADGYRVSYVYGGETYTTHMQRHPGDSIRVRVRVSPVQS